jgi:hypothetical protein
MQVDPTDERIAYVVADNFGDVTGGGQVWATFNAGRSWTDISGNLPDVPIYTVALHPKAGQDAIYVGTDQGVYVTENGGTTWRRPAPGLPNVQIHELEVNLPLGILAAATHGRGMWQLQVASAGRSLPWRLLVTSGRRSVETFPAVSALAEKPRLVAPSPDVHIAVSSAADEDGQPAVPESPPTVKPKQQRPQPPSSSELLSESDSLISPQTW